METLLTILGGIVLVCCLAYFRDQDVSKRDDRLFETNESVPTVEDELEESSRLPVVATQAGVSIEG